MQKNEKIDLLKNIFFGFGGQLIIMILGIIIPRIMMVSYGSDANGLLNAVSQIFAYMALLEAGIGQAAKNSYFKPISKHNRNDITTIFSIANSYFRRITIIYAIGVIVISFLSPVLIKTEIDYSTVFWIILLEGASGVVTFYYIQNISTFLSADGKSYVNNGINVVNRILSYAVKIVMAAKGADIVLLQLMFFFITVAKVFVYRAYFKKYYNWLKIRSISKVEKLRDRNSYVLTEIAWTVFSSTDMIVLSTFLSTKVTSVYVVYNLVFSSISAVLNTVYMSVNYILGQSYHTSIKKYAEIHDSFTSMFFGGITVLMSTAYLLILPFIRLYTAGITDTEYIYESLPVFFCLVQLISWSRYVTGNLSGIAGYARPTSHISLVEALVKITLSIILINYFGILIATIIALPLKVIYLTWLSERIILHRNPIRYLVILGINYLLFGATVIFSKYITFDITSYLSFLTHCILVFLVIMCIGTLLNILVNPRLLSILKNILLIEREENG